MFAIPTRRLKRGSVEGGLLAGFEIVFAGDLSETVVEEGDGFIDVGGFGEVAGPGDLGEKEEGGEEERGDGFHGLEGCWHEIMRSKVAGGGDRSPKPRRVGG